MFLSLPSLTQVLRRSLLVACALALLVTTPILAEGEFPDAWYWLDNAVNERPEDHINFEGQLMPDLTVADWVNGEVTAEDMEGKIVVIDFWATWCGPCIAAIPHNNEVMHAYKDEGVVFFAVCVSGQPDQAPVILEENGAEYPAAYVDGPQVETDWPLIWYPTYAVMDATGTVRAVGLKPDSLESVIDTLLDEQALAAGQARIPQRWLEGNEESRERLSKLEDQSADPPALEVEDWINSDGLTLDELEGKVVLLSFGAVWSAPWIDQIPMVNDLQSQYADDGLVVISICSSLEGASLPQVAEEYGIAFPVAVDIDNGTNRAYGPNGFPDYYLLGRDGSLRIADLKNEHLEDAIAALLAEPAPSDEDGEGDDASSEVEAE